MRALLVALVLGCGESTPAPQGDPCVARGALEGGGAACALPPSVTDPAMSDAFGLHAIGFPPGGVGRETPVYVHFVGTGGRPALADGTFPEIPILADGTARGFMVIALAYDNVNSLLQLCGDDVACYGPVRWEIVTGEDAAAPYSGRKRVVPPDDSDHRLAALAATLRATGLVDALPAPLAGDAVDWSRLRVGGHSQGGGQAGVIARRRAVERACMFASPVDASRALQPARWIDDAWETPVARRRVVVHEGDQFFSKIEANVAAMGMTLDAEWRRLDAPSDNPHGFVMYAADAPARAARAWACFEP
jgi:hypothetical protein